MPNPSSTDPAYSTHFKILQSYSACDISDALVKLKVPGAGFVPDLHPYSSSNQPGNTSAPVTIAPASTVLFVPKGTTANTPAAAAATTASAPASGISTAPVASNIPPGSHWVDLTPPGTAVVIKQPEGQRNAVCGGIMALRMKACGAAAIIVSGRARDLDELRSTGLPIWAKGTSTVGAGAESSPWAIQVPLEVDGTVVNPGDLVFSDPANGVVVIPRDKVEQVVELLPKLTAADDRIKEDVDGGGTVKEAMARHRANL